MLRIKRPLACLMAAGWMAAAGAAHAQQQGWGQQRLDTPQTRLRPIGSATPRTQQSRYPQSQPTPLNPIRQVQFEPPPLGGTSPSGVGVPSVGAQPGAAAPLPGVGNNAPPAFPSQPPAGVPQRNLPAGPGSIVGSPALGGGAIGSGAVGPPVTVSPGVPGGMIPVPQQPTPGVTTVPGLPSSSDFAPMATPQLNDGFATIDNCNCISGPSSYVAATGYGDCGVAPVTYQAPAYVAPPAQVAAPVVLPGTAPVVVPTPKGAPVKPLVSFGQQRYQVEVGQGLFGQPVAYVPGQRFRNWIRYIFP